jgi:predicted O-methyltransferase YrrM
LLADIKVIMKDYNMYLERQENYETQFANNINFLKNFITTPPKRILEIGCYKGKSTALWLQHFLTDDGTIVCIDPFNESDEDPFGSSDPKSNFFIEQEFTKTVEAYRKPTQTVDLLRGRSYYELASLINKNEMFDLVYIDGNHTAPSVITDACMSFGLLNKQGIMLFDDFLMREEIGVNSQHQNFLDWPKLAIDSFTSLFHKNIEILFINYQYAIRKW